LLCVDSDEGKKREYDAKLRRDEHLRHHENSGRGRNKKGKERKEEEEEEEEEEDDDSVLIIHSVYLTLEELFFGCEKKLKVTRKRFRSARGSEFVEESEIINIPINPGSGKGDSYCIRQLGDIRPGKIPADILFLVEEKPHLLFRRVGNDLHHSRIITFGDSLTPSFELRNVDGEELHVEWVAMKGAQVPVQDGDSLCIKGKGMCDQGNPKLRGDLWIEFRIDEKLKRQQEAEDRWRREVEEEMARHQRRRAMEERRLHEEKILVEQMLERERRRENPLNMNSLKRELPTSQHTEDAFNFAGWKSTMNNEQQPNTATPSIQIPVPPSKSIPVFNASTAKPWNWKEVVAPAIDNINEATEDVKMQVDDEGEASASASSAFLEKEKQRHSAAHKERSRTKAQPRPQVFGVPNESEPVFPLHSTLFRERIRKKPIPQSKF